MSFAGAVSSMLTSLKNNKLLLRKNKSYHADGRETGQVGAPLRFKNKMSAEELVAFGEELRETNRKRLRTEFILVTVISLIAMVCLYYLFF